MNLDDYARCRKCRAYMLLLRAEVTQYKSILVSVAYGRSPANAASVERYLTCTYCGGEIRPLKACSSCGFYREDHVQGRCLYTFGHFTGYIA